MSKYRNVFHFVRSIGGRGLILLLVLVILPVLMSSVGGRLIAGQTAVHIAEAAEPLVEGEVGQNDFQISQMGTAADFRNIEPVVGYNFTDDYYLVLWAADDSLNGENAISRINRRLMDGNGQPVFDIDGPVVTIGPELESAPELAVAYNQVDNNFLLTWTGVITATGEKEIMGVYLTGAGYALGDPFNVTLHGLFGDTTADVQDPAVVHNPQTNEFLVVYAGDRAAGAADGEFEIFYSRIHGSNGSRLGFGRISQMGPNGSSSYDGLNPEVAVNLNTGEYLAVWFGDSDGSDGGVTNNEYEIFGQRLSPTGGQIGSDDFRISDMGPNGDDEYDAFAPAVAFNSTDSNFLVTWRGDDTFGPGGDEDEIYGQLLAADGQEVGTNDFRISHMGPDADADYDAALPVVAYNPVNNQYVVSWEADDNSAGAVDDDIEIFSRAVSAAGVPLGSSQNRISEMGPAGDTAYRGEKPAMAYNPAGNNFFVVWEGRDDRFEQFDSPAAVYGQLLDGLTGQESGENDVMASHFMEIIKLFNVLVPNAAVYNPAANEYFVVWSADVNSGGSVDNEFEVYGQRLDAATGQKIGARLRISDMGPNGNIAYMAISPAVVFNSDANEYLVVWYGDDVVNEEFEIYGQRLTAAGVEVGVNDFRISDMGPDGDNVYGAFSPAVAFNSDANEYLVTWHGDDNTGGMVAGEYEIFGQRLAAGGSEIGANDFRISNMGGSGDVDYPAQGSDVVYNSVDKQYLVVWHGVIYNIESGPAEFEIIGQRLSAAGVEIGANDFRVSDMGPDQDFDFDAFSPAVTHNTAGNEYLVVWRGRDDAAFEFQIYGQRLNAAGTEIGVNDFRISNMVPEQSFPPRYPDVVYNPTAGEYLVVWEGYSLETGTAEKEIFGQRLSETGLDIGLDDFRLSDMGPDGDLGFIATFPSVVYGGTADEYLVIWGGSDIEPMNIPDEIYGQRFVASPVDPPTPTATSTSSPTPTATATSSPTPTATATSSPTPTATATSSPTPTATATSSPTPTATATSSPTPTATNTNTPTPTATSTASPTPTATSTGSPTPPGPTPTATVTPEPTGQPQPGNQIYMPVVVSGG